MTLHLVWSASGPQRPEEGPPQRTLPSIHRDSTLEELRAFLRPVRPPPALAPPAPRLTVYALQDRLDGTAKRSHLEKEAAE